MIINTMTLNYKAVVFDLDGTLVDSLFDLGSSMNSVLLNHSLPIHPMDKYRQFVGNGMAKLVERALPKEFKHKSDLYLKALIHYYETVCLLNTKPYHGIEMLLSKLQDLKIPLAVITNKKHNITVKMVQNLFKDIDFKYVQGDVFDGKRKPDAAYTLEYIRQCKLEPHEVLFVGDSNIDIQTANNAAMDSCGVLWGFRTKSELVSEGATYLAQTPMDIYNIII